MIDFYYQDYKTQRYHLISELNNLLKNDYSWSPTTLLLKKIRDRLVNEQASYFNDPTLAFFVALDKLQKYEELNYYITCWKASG